MRFFTHCFQRFSLFWSNLQRNHATSFSVGLLLLGLTMLVLGFASGCGRTVLIPEDSPIRVGPQTRAKIYILLEDKWVLSDTAVTIPEGWYCVPPSYVDDVESKEVSPS